MKKKILLLQLKKNNVVGLQFHPERRYSGMNLLSEIILDLSKNLLSKKV